MAWNGETVTVEHVLAKLTARGISVPPGPLRVDAYGDSPELSAELLSLIKSGKKRAGTSLLWGVEVDGEALPRVGDLEIVLDHHNEPALLTRIVSVDIVAFKDVDATYAAIEGEGDGSLAYWREGHWAFFSRECARIGRTPSEDMPVVCSVFEVLRALGTD